MATALAGLNRQLFHSKHLIRGWDERWASLTVMQNMVQTARIKNQLTPMEPQEQDFQPSLYVISVKHGYCKAALINMWLRKTRKCSFLPKHQREREHQNKLSAQTRELRACSPQNILNLFSHSCFSVPDGSNFREMFVKTCRLSNTSVYDVSSNQIGTLPLTVPDGLLD